MRPLGLPARLLMTAGGLVFLLTLLALGFAAAIRWPAPVLLASILGALALQRNRAPKPEPIRFCPGPAWTPSENLGILRLLATKPAATGLGLYLGTVQGVHRWLDLRKAPHVLVAGTTGSGKSQWLRTALLTLTAGTAPDRLRLILIDPKRVELAPFKTLPHVLHHVTEPADARRILDALSAEMDRRYAVMESHGVSDIAALPLSDRLQYPFIVVAADEYADLILTTRRTPREIEPVLARLLGLGRAAGIHVLLATQRPDRTVVTGLIKANAPARIAFRTANALESRIILDSRGAEALGRPGDGLVVSHEIQGAPGKPVAFRSLMVPEPAVRQYAEAK